MLLAVADRLLADRENWQAFDPNRYFPRYLDQAVRIMYPQADELWKNNGTEAFVEMHQ